MRRILLVEDHPLVREGLRRILTELPEPAEVAETGNAIEAMRRVRGARWDLVLLDLQLPGRFGVDLLKQIVTQQPGLPVLVISMYPEEQFALRVLELGAVGYLTKDTAPRDLLAAVKKVLGGDIAISDSVGDKLIDRLRARPSSQPHEDLNEREFQVFRLLAQGMRLGQIADILHLSRKTVGKYRTRILTKMGMGSEAEMAIYATTQGIIAGK